VSSELVTFSQVVAKARERDQDSLEIEASGASFGKRATSVAADTVARTAPAAVADNYQAPSDRDLATRVTGAIARLQDAMDAAIRAGLVVEPDFQVVNGRFNDFGISVDSHICTVQIFRKLA
jgi:hypothetical protein